MGDGGGGGGGGRGGEEDGEGEKTHSHIEMAPRNGLQNLAISAASFSS